MDTSVIICSTGRPLTLHETVLGLLKQTVRPDSILLSLSDDTSVLSDTSALPSVRCVLGPRGSSIQRNTAIPLVRTAYTLFLDDDVELASDYLAQMERLFAADPSIVAASGGVAADGAADGREIRREAAIRAILNYRGNRECGPYNDLYGCNMFVRSEVLRLELFDERLPSYAWLEDLDFSERCKRHGRLVRNRAALMAHLGTRSGRTSDVRYGYTKVANPWYLWRKSVLTSLAEVVVRYWAKTTAGNLVRAIMTTGAQGVNYKKRLLGNLMAYRDLLLRRIDPQNVLKIEDERDPLELQTAANRGASTLPSFPIPTPGDHSLDDH